MKLIKEGTYQLVVMLTFYDGRDTDLIEILKNVPRRRMAPTIREMMRNGTTARISFKKDDEIDTSGLGIEL